MNNTENEDFSRSSGIGSVAIISGKGGTGKTLIAASLGYVLSHCGFKTLLVDADLYTNGLTFLSLAEFPRRIPFSLYGILEGFDNENVQFIPIPHEFCNGNLFILPSVSKRRRSLTELALSGQIGLTDFCRILRNVINTAVKSFGIQYVIIDSRGGTDHTSIGVALGVDGFITVTEADKTSWDVGRMLLDSIEDTSDELLRLGFNSEENSSQLRGILENVQKLGFLINKNVLPSEAIETFLKKEWECPHLTTIPLDENAIRFFQDDKIPIAEDLSCPFSLAIVPLIRKVFVSEQWRDNNIKALEKLEMEVRKADELRKRDKQRELRSNRFALVMKLYGSVIATALLAYFAMKTVIRGETDLVVLLAVIMATVLIFLMTVSDPKFINQIFKLVFTRRKPPEKY